MDTTDSDTLERKLVNYQRKYEAQKKTELKTEVFSIKDYFPFIYTYFKDDTSIFNNLI